MKLILCELCGKIAHGIFTTDSGTKVTRCLECKPPAIITTAFKPVNKHLKE